MKKQKSIKKWPKLLGFFVLLTFLAVLPLVSKAMVKDEKTENVYVGADEVVDYNLTEAGNLVDINGVVNGDVWVIGSEVRINAHVKGDVFAIGNNVTVSGPVEGNVAAAASNVVVEGDVEGSVRVAGSNVEVKGKVGKNVYGFGSNVRLNKESEVGMHVRMGGNFVNVFGKIGGNLDVDGVSVALDSEVGGNVNSNLGQTGTLILEKNALVKGNLIYTAEKDVEIKEGAVVEGETTKKAFEAKAVKKKWGSTYFFKKLTSLFSLLVVGLILVSLLKKKVLEITKQMLGKPGASLGWGLVFFIVVPIVCLLLLITIIGVPLAFIVMALYVIALYISKVLAGITIGYWLLNYLGDKKKNKSRKDVNLIWAMVLGLVVFMILINIPVIGWILKLLAIWWALGALIEVKKKVMAEWK